MQAVQCSLGENWSRQCASRNLSGQRKLDLNPHSSEAPDTDPLYHALAFEVTTVVQSDFCLQTRRVDYYITADDVCVCLSVCVCACVYMCVCVCVCVSVCLLSLIHI